jgi:hypothetical protein
MARKLVNGMDKYRSWQGGNVRDEAGNVAGTAEGNADNFRAFYNDLLHNTGDTTQGYAEYAKMDTRSVDRKFRAPTMHELKREIRSSKDVAPGENGAPALVWRSMLGATRLLDLLLSIMTDCWEKESTPEEWRTFYMMAIPKTGDLTMLKNWRGLAMSDTFAKLFGGILQKRMEDYYEDIAPEYCNGFRRGRSRTDSIYTLKEFLRQRKVQGLDSWVVLWDAVKMFDRVKREFL